MNFLEGKKTYLSAGIMVVLAGLKAMAYIDEQTYQVFMSLAVAAGLTALRMAVPNK